MHGISVLKQLDHKIGLFGAVISPITSVEASTKDELKEVIKEKQKIIKIFARGSCPHHNK